MPYHASALASFASLALYTISLDDQWAEPGSGTNRFPQGRRLALGMLAKIHGTIILIER
jgi:hypothetical protein